MSFGQEWLLVFSFLTFLMSCHTQKIIRFTCQTGKNWQTGKKWRALGSQMRLLTTRADQPRGTGHPSHPEGQGQPHLTADDLEAPSHHPTVLETGSRRLDSWSGFNGQQMTLRIRRGLNYFHGRLGRKLSHFSTHTWSRHQAGNDGDDITKPLL